MIRSLQNKAILLQGIICFFLFAQSQAGILSERDFARMVLAHHPVAKQADLMRMRASAQMLQAKGSFDPTLFGYADQKEFSGKKYYGVTESGLKWDSPFGLGLKAGYQTANGIYLNPEDVTPAAGLTFAGITMPLGQGLLIDKRRAALWQARIAQKSNEAERLGMLNDLMYDAIKSYWSWSESYNQYIVYRKSADVARVRFDGIKGSVANGESPPIDTVEALIQLQNMLTQVIKWENEFRNAGLELSVFLWDDQANPLQLNPETVPLMTDSLKINPGGVFTDTISDRLSAIVNRHPDILVTRYKIDTYRIENRLYRDKLKPKLNLSYNLLAKGQGITSEQMQYLYMSQNYKFGAEFVFPLFLRRERGDIRMSNVKINETNYALSWKLLALQNKIQMAINDVKNNFRQLELLDQMVENYKTMLDGEEQRFLSGESSVFLINARQQKLVEAENKMVELKAKYFKSIISLFWSCGTATQIIN